MNKQCQFLELPNISFGDSNRQHFYQCFCSQIACVRALWLFSDKTELFGREFCDRGQNIVLRVIFSSGGVVATTVNRTLSKPDPQQTLPLPPACSLILVAKKS